MIGRGLTLHVVLFAGAVASAVYVWTRDQKAVAAVAAGDVTVWQGKADDVKKIDFEGKGKKAVLEARRDAAGRWFDGVAVTTPLAPDGGIASSKTEHFLSVSAGDKIASGLVPLHASRDIGKLEGERAAEFGLAEPEGTVTVTTADREHKVLLGAVAPGGAERYVRDPANGEVYVVKGDVFRDLSTGESALLERDLHGFKDASVERIKITAGAKTREVLRKGPEGKRIWADPKDPDKADETVGNWIGKIDRLRVTEFAPDLTGTQPVVHIDYTTTGTPAGAFLELAKVFPAASDAKPDYYVKTERLRQWAKVPAASAEQIEQDAQSVVP